MVPKLAREKRDTLLAELAAAKEKVQHAHDTDVVVPKELEKMQHAHNMTENTHSIALWLTVLLAGGVVTISVFRSISWSRRQGFKEATVSCERPTPNKALCLSTRAIFETE